MTSENKPTIFDTFVSEITKNLNEVIDGIRKDFNGPTNDGQPEEPVTETPTADEDVDQEDVILLTGEELLALLLEDDEDGEEVQPAWEAIELLRKAEVAADKGDDFASTNYIAIADRYIKLAETFGEVEITFS